MHGSRRRSLAPPSRAALALAAACMLAACGPGAGPSGSGAPPSAAGGLAPKAPAAAPPAPDELPPKPASAFRDASAKSPAEYLEEPRYAQADVRRGELLTLACKACHALDPGEKNDLGPSLRGVIGRRAASLEGFEYSDALESSGIVWTPEAIEHWLADPAAFVPGTKMKFTGYRGGADRRDVVAYLLRRQAAAEGQSSSDSP
ncbi:MAG TPA: c-type cytochrome [Gammaproteobacteria bacterium]|nr:c-type cytochrome [Gammaproteobacteria bacterium]